MIEFKFQFLPQILIQISLGEEQLIVVLVRDRFPFQQFENLRQEADIQSGIQVRFPLRHRRILVGERFIGPAERFGSEQHPRPRQFERFDDIPQIAEEHHVIGVSEEDDLIFFVIFRVFVLLKVVFEQVDLPTAARFSFDVVSAAPFLTETEDRRLDSIFVRRLDVTVEAVGIGCGYC